MNNDKKLNSTRSEAKVQWWTILAFFGMVLAFTACKKDSYSPEDTPEQYPSLMVANQVADDWKYITSVRLIGYEFTNLNIPVGDSQTFTLDKGMSGGYEDINVIVVYNIGYIHTQSKSIKVNFTKGEATTITLKGCTGEGCDGIYLEYNP